MVSERDSLRGRVELIFCAESVTDLNFWYGKSVQTRRTSIKQSMWVTSVIS